jgi:hypothetical protein
MRPYPGDNRAACSGRIYNADDARQNRLPERSDENPDTKNRRDASNH